MKGCFCSPNIASVSLELPRCDFFCFRLLTKETEGIKYGNLFVLIDVNFASGIKNINFGFTLTPICVSTVYSVLSRVLWEKKITGVLLGWDSNPRKVLFVFLTLNQTPSSVPLGSFQFWYCKTKNSGPVNYLSYKPCAIVDPPPPKKKINK